MEQESRSYKCGPEAIFQSNLPRLLGLGAWGLGLAKVTPQSPIIKESFRLIIVLWRANGSGIKGFIFKEIFRIVYIVLV